MLVRLFLAAFGCFCAYAQNPAGGARHAWLIGNGNYTNIGKLAAPARNVDALDAALKAARFRTVITRDTTLDNFIKARDEFLASVKPGDSVLIYYSGFALQARPDNYLLPVEYDTATPLLQVASRAPSISGLLDVVDEKKPYLKIIVIDAPWETPASVARTGRGLAVVDIGESTEVAIALSSQAGQTIPVSTADSPTVFTQRLATIIDQPGVPLDDVFLGLQREARTLGQRPFAILSFTVPFYFREPLPQLPFPPGTKKSNRIDRQEYVAIGAGSFRMGCVPGDKECEKDELPQHRVTISKPFWMGVAEVDVDSYQRYVATAKERKMPKDKPAWDRDLCKTYDPVTFVAWDDAQAFCKWAGGRLPTEAEWEYAARAGTTNQIWPLDFKTSREKANFYGEEGNDRFPNTSPVKKFDPNAFGLFDMAGNVWEWTADWYSETYYGQSPEVDPTGPPTGRNRVIRGGSWYSDPRKHLRMSIRFKGEKDGGNTVGFRCVLEYNEETHKKFTE